MPKRITATPVLVMVLLMGSTAAAGPIEDDIAKLLTTTGVEATDPSVQAAWRGLADRGAEALPALLSAMAGAEPIAANWLRTCVDAIGEEALAAGELPVDALLAFLADTDNAPRARRVAYEWIIAAKPESRLSLLANLSNDPSLALRYDAVANLLERADAEPEPTLKKEILQAALKSARDLPQVETAIEELDKLGEKHEVADVMGFLRQWHVIGTFDNAGLAGFEKPYPPEATQDLAAKHAGVEGEAAWQFVNSDDAGGDVDLKAVFGKQPETIAYAFTTFQAEAGEAELRYQTKCASRVWLNGELVASNEVYHSGGAIDQYRAPVTLAEGENTVLIKTCQNEQRMPWEGDWAFRLRVVDELGTPVATQQDKVFTFNR